mmetsp:Transcript_27913/g.86345  ORF Transcript_27913/g.86345 Transcript_27913/m.86345 type:complete len:928 (+) Transcript_27913:155-2938(+)
MSQAAALPSKGQAPPGAAEETVEAVELLRCDTYNSEPPSLPTDDEAARLAVKAPEVAAKVAELANAGEGARYEPELARNPYQLKTWIAYLKASEEAPFAERRLVYERAVRLLPRSYKLWRRYLEEAEDAVGDRWRTSGRAKVLVLAYERCLEHLGKMPRLWLDYCRVLRKMGKGTELRRAFDRALRALPVTQHEHVWPEYIDWAERFGVERTATTAYVRYCMFEPQRREAFCDYLVTQKRYGRAVAELAACVDDNDFVSPSGKSKHQLWMRLCDLCAAHPEELPKSLDVDAIIRSGLARFTDEVGRLWCKLADYYIRLGRFDHARDVYEEACTTVVTARDFGLVFDAYAQFEESVLTAKMGALEETPDGERDDEDPWAANPQTDVELRLARLERLMSRRPLLLSSVLLRQNPHAVREWHARAALVADDAAAAIECYSDAVKTVDPAKAAGRPHTLWTAFAEYYETRGDVANARVVLERATEQPFRAVDDLAAIYCWWVEMELKRDCHDEALDVARKACLEPPAAARRRRAQGKGYVKDAAPVGERVHRSPKLWSLYLDLEESLGTLDSARAAYDRCLELRVATPQIVANYAALLEEHEYFEDAFAAYERGVALFRWPHVRELWRSYLKGFVDRYGGAKLERARDLFEQALRGAPPADAAGLYVDYAKLEEAHGLARRAMAVYERAATTADDDRAFAAWRLYAAKVERAFGAPKARGVYERAVKKLAKDDDAKRMCLAFSQLERGLGEVDRARAILAHGSQFADPRLDDHYWQSWRDFEVQHGNEDTFREMLRVKRSVETARSAQNYIADTLLKVDNPLMSDAEAAARTGSAAASRKRGAEEGGAAETEMAALERQAARIVEATKAADAPPAADPNEIDLDDDDDDDGDFVLATKPVPAAVFGSAAAAAGELADETSTGALARFQKKG